MAFKLAFTVGALLMLACSLPAAAKPTSMKLHPALKHLGVSDGSAQSGSAVQAAADNRASNTAQQPAMAEVPKTTGSARSAPANAAWQQQATTLAFNPLSNIRAFSPLCPSGQEATACSAFSGNTAVVVSSVMPSIGTNSGVKTTQCFCDFRNTVNAFVPANGNEIYRCVAYCQ